MNLKTWNFICAFRQDDTIYQIECQLTFSIVIVKIIDLVKTYLLDIGGNKVY